MNETRCNKSGFDMFWFTILGRCKICGCSYSCEGESAQVLEALGHRSWVAGPRKRQAARLQWWKKWQTWQICTMYVYIIFVQYDIYIYALQFSKNGYRYIRDVIYALLWSLVSAHTKVTSTTAISLSMWPQFTWNLFQVHAWLRC